MMGNLGDAIKMYQDIQIQITNEILNPPEKLKLDKTMILLNVRTIQDAMVWRGVCSYEINDYETAVERFYQYMQITKGQGKWSTYCRLMTAHILAQLGNRESALKLLANPSENSIYYREANFFINRWFDESLVKPEAKPEEKPSEDKDKDKEKEVKKEDKAEEKKKSDESEKKSETPKEEKSEKKAEPKEKETTPEEKKEMKAPEKAEAKPEKSESGKKESPEKKPENGDKPETESKEKPGEEKKAGEKSDLEPVKAEKPEAETKAEEKPKESTEKE